MFGTAPAAIKVCHEVLSCDAWHPLQRLLPPVIRPGMIVLFENILQENIVTLLATENVTGTFGKFKMFSQSYFLVEYFIIWQNVQEFITKFVHKHDLDFLTSHRYQLFDLKRNVCVKHLIFIVNYERCLILKPFMSKVASLLGRSEIDVRCAHRDPSDNKDLLLQG